MKNSLINEEYLKIVSKDKEESYNEYLKMYDKVSNSSCIYEGKPVPFLYSPIFFTKKELDDFENITNTLMGILTKVINHYVVNPEYRKLFGFSKTLEELIIVDPGYDYNVPMGRFDLFYNDINEFKFCEFNTDGSSAMNETNVLERFILESKAIQEIKEKYNVTYQELVYKWVDESIEIYKQWDKSEKTPNVAIVDFEGGKTVNEFEEFKKAYIDRGFNTEIVDPRRLTFRDGKLFYNDMEINLIYRRLVTSDLMRRVEETPDFIKGYKNGAACVVGPFRSQIPHNKIIFKVLHDTETLKILSKEEQEFVKSHIPFTKVLTSDVELINDVLENKDKYVLKPTDFYASLGVYVGTDLSEDEWKKRVEEGIDREYIVQEFVNPYTHKFARFNDDGELKIEEFKHIIGLYMYREKFAGMYTRVNQNNNISSLFDCYTVPNLIVSDC